MTMKLRSGGSWKNVAQIKLRSGGIWKNVAQAYVRAGGVWKIFFSSSTIPDISTKVTLTSNSTTYPATLTGRNYHWENATVLEYAFQYYDGSQWLDVTGSNGSGIITNPATGSSNTKAYIVQLGDLPLAATDFRFSVTATNTDVTPSSVETSVSTSVTINNDVYLVTLDPRGGTLTPNKTEYTVSSGNFMQLPTPVKTGFEFSGWYTAITGGTRVGGGGSYYYPTADITIYAQWSDPIQYTITWNAVHVTNPTPSVGTYGTIVTAPTVTRSGYTFLGWYDTPSGDYTFNIVPGGQWTITGNRTFYARYTAARPTAPTAFTATTNSTTNITLGWAGATGEITSYGIWYGYSANFSPAPTTPPDITTNLGQTQQGYMFDTSPQPGESRWYWIRSQGPGGISDWFPAGNGVYGRRDALPVNVTRPEVTPATGGAAGSTTYYSDNGYWSPDDADGVYAYRWEYTDQPGVWLPITGATSSSYSPSSTFFSSGYNTPIRCRVEARGTTLNTTAYAYSNSAVVNVPNATPPTSVSTTVGNGSVTVNWSGATNATKYRIFWSGLSTTSADSNVTFDLQVNAPTTSATFTGFTNGSTYYFWVAAASSNNLYTSYNSAPRASGTPVAPVVLAPTNSSAPTLTPTSISVGTQLSAGIGSWNNSPTGYDIRIYRGTANVATFETLVASRSGSSTANLNYTVTQADYNSGQRYFRTFVDASNSGGASGLVAGQERGPIADPAVAPSGGTVTVTPSTGTAGTTSFSGSTSGWSGTGTITYSYAWQRFTNGVFQWQTLSTSTSFSPTVSQNSTALAWALVVTATNSAGSATASSSFTVNNPASPPASTAPSQPANLTNTYSGGPTWSGSWSASTGTTPITYYWTLYQSATNGGSVLAQASGSTTGTSFSRSMSNTNGFWAYFTVYASNSAGNSTTATSGWA